MKDLSKYTNEELEQMYYGIETDEDFELFENEIRKRNFPEQTGESEWELFINYCLA